MVTMRPLIDALYALDAVTLDDAADALCNTLTLAVLRQQAPTRAQQQQLLALVQRALDAPALVAALKAALPREEG